MPKITADSEAARARQEAVWQKLLSQMPEGAPLLDAAEDAGWRLVENERKGGTKAGHYDYYFHPPDGGKVCRSANEVARHYGLELVRKSPARPSSSLPKLTTTLLHEYTAVRARARCGGQNYEVFGGHDKDVLVRRQPSADPAERLPPLLGLPAIMKDAGVVSASMDCITVAAPADPLAPFLPLSAYLKDRGGRLEADHRLAAERAALSIFWPFYRQWYRATATAFDPTTGRHTVVYAADGVKESLHLCWEKYRLRPEPEEPEVEEEEGHPHARLLVSLGVNKRKRPGRSGQGAGRGTRIRPLLSQPSTDPEAVASLLQLNGSRSAPATPRGPASPTAVTLASMQPPPAHPHVIARLPSFGAARQGGDALQQTRYLNGPLARSSAAAASVAEASAGPIAGGAVPQAMQARQQQRAPAAEVLRQLQELRQRLKSRPAGAAAAAAASKQEPAAKQDAAAAEEKPAPKQQEAQPDQATAGQQGAVADAHTEDKAAPAAAAAASGEPGGAAVEASAVPDEAAPASAHASVAAGAAVPEEQPPIIASSPLQDGAAAAAIPGTVRPAPAAGRAAEAATAAGEVMATGAPTPPNPATTEATLQQPAPEAVPAAPQGGPTAVADLPPEPQQTATAGAEPAAAVAEAGTAAASDEAAAATNEAAVTKAAGRAEEDEAIAAALGLFRGAGELDPAAQREAVEQLVVDLFHLAGSKLWSAMCLYRWQVLLQMPPREVWALFGSIKAMLDFHDEEALQDFLLAQAPVDAVPSTVGSSSSSGATEVDMDSLDVVRDGKHTRVVQLFAEAKSAGDANLRYMAVTYLVAGSFRGFRERHRDMHTYFARLRRDPVGPEAHHEFLWLQKLVQAKVPLGHVRDYVTVVASTEPVSMET